MEAGESKCPRCGDAGPFAQPCPRHPDVHFIPANPGPEDLDIGRLFGDYLALVRLGQGGMGTVFEARDLKRQRTVALKVLADDLLENEARALSRLKSRHVVRVYDWGRAHGRAWLALDLVAGTPLSEVRLERGDLLPVLRDVCRGLADAHQEGLVHRDLKPGNIMVQPEMDGHWSACLIDFGIAKDVTGGGDTDHHLGTARYMAPEQFLRAGICDRTDVYALALITAELLTGRPICQETDFHRLGARRTWPEFNPLGEVEAHLPEAFGPVLRRAVAFDPAQRPNIQQFFAEVQAAFSPPAQQTPGASGPAGTAGILPALAFQERRAAPGRWPGSRLWILLIVALLGGAGTIYRLTRPATPPDAQPPDASPIADAGRPDAARIPDAGPPDATPPPPVQPFDLPIPGGAPVPALEVADGLQLQADTSTTLLYVCATPKDHPLALHAGEVLHTCAGRPLSRAFTLTACRKAICASAGTDFVGCKLDQRLHTSRGRFALKFGCLGE